MKLNCIMDDVQGDFSRPPDGGKTLATVIAKKNRNEFIKEQWNIHEKEDGHYGIISVT